MEKEPDKPSDAERPEKEPIKKEPGKPSQAKINANRENAKKSTGPKSERGKLVSSMNPLTHGVFLKRTLADCPPMLEDPAVVMSIFEGLIASYAPVGILEHSVLWDVTDLQVKTTRLQIWEVAGIDERVTAAVDAARRRDDEERFDLLSKGKRFIPGSDEDPAQRESIPADVLQYQIEIVARLKRGDDELSSDPGFRSFVWSEETVPEDGRDDPLDDKKVDALFASLSPAELDRLRKKYLKEMEVTLDAMWRMRAESVPREAAIKKALIPGDVELNKIMKYSTHLARLIESKIRLLEHLQAARRKREGRG